MKITVEAKAIAREICIGMGDDPDREGSRLTAYDTAAKRVVARLSTRASDPASEVVERLVSALMRTVGGMKLSVAGKPFRDMAETLAEADAALALATTPSSPDASRMGASEVERVARYYPDDGGLKKPVRDISECLSVTQVILKHFRPDLFPTALTPVSGHTDGTWDEAIEAAAKVAEDELASRRADFKGDPLDNFTRGQINSALRILAAIRNLSPRAARSEGEG